MGKESRQIGSHGEDLFGFLIDHWGAHWVHTPSAQGTDGYLEWDDLPGVRLWVQIKTRRKRNKKNAREDCLLVQINKADTLKAWSTYGPILVVCVLEEARAWWLDTLPNLYPWIPPSPHTFQVPFNQPVDESTRKAVLHVALTRPRSLPLFVRSTLPTRIALNLPLHIIKEIVEFAYRDMQSMGVLERDVTALAVARLIHLEIIPFTVKGLDFFLELVSDRLLSREWGGRSFTLGALSSLLYPKITNKFDPAFISTLTRAATRAIEQRTFVNPEFGLLIAASLVQHFPERNDLPGLVEHLVKMVAANPQNLQVESIARRLHDWLDRRWVPIEGLFPVGWLTDQVIRPIEQDAEVFLDLEAADNAVNHILKNGVMGATPEELNLIDQLTRLKAVDQLSKWLSMCK